MTYVDILGHPTWMTVGVEKDETVLLLHGGIVDSRSLLDSIGAATGAQQTRQRPSTTKRWPTRPLRYLSIWIVRRT